MTSNLGSSIIQDNFEGIHEKNKDAIVESTKVEVMNLLRQTIRPEFLNRVDDIILFQPLLKNDIKEIVKIQLADLKKLVSQNGLEIVFSEYLIDFLAENGFDIQFGARPLKRLIQKEIVNTLSKNILAGSLDKMKPVLIDVFDGTVVIRNELNRISADKGKIKIEHSDN